MAIRVAEYSKISHFKFLRYSSKYNLTIVSPQCCIIVHPAAGLCLKVLYVVLSYAGKVKYNYMYLIPTLYIVHVAAITVRENAAPQHTRQ